MKVLEIRERKTKSCYPLLRYLFTIYTCTVNKYSSGHSKTHSKGTYESGFVDEKGLNTSESYMSHERG